MSKRAMPYTPLRKEHGVYMHDNTAQRVETTYSVERRTKHKRLADAELAAEYWRLKADLNGMARITDSPVHIDKRATIMFRFATTPHYDEVDDG